MLDPNRPEVSIWLFASSGGGYDQGVSTWINIYFNQVEVLAAPENSGDVSYPEGLEDHPVTNVAWADAAAYCDWRGARLPSEAEWEYAARGPEEFLYPWGNMAGAALANVNDAFDGTTSVGSFTSAASPFGVEDMAGNVWEWTADWYQADYYAVAPRENPTGPDSGTLRVARGGGFRITDIVGLDEARATHRRPLDPNVAADDVGFRCALSLSGVQTGAVPLLPIFVLQPSFLCSVTTRVEFADDDQTG